MKINPSSNFKSNNCKKQTNQELLERSIKRKVYDFFDKGIGWRLTALVVDFKFLVWKLQHPGASFSNFYAGSIASRLKRGQSHKTLGNKKFLSGSLISNPAQLNQLENQSRGTNYFDLAIQYGLKPEHTCVDYGCGSLRVGQHLIDYLQPEKYLGLDIVSDFYEAGKSLLSKQILGTKKPQFKTINPTSIKTANMQAPQFILSFAVLKHVPPNELDAYFGNIVSMMSLNTQAVITFNQAKQTTRSGAKIWDYCQEDLITSIRNQSSDLYCVIKPFYEEESLPRISVLLIRKEELHQGSN